MPLTKAQNVTLLQDAVQLRERSRTFFGGNFISGINSVIADAVANGKDQLAIDIVDQCEQAISQADNLWQQLDAVIVSVFPNLGVLAGAADPNNQDESISKFHDYLTSNNESIRSTDYVEKFTSLTPGSSNVGTGKIGVLNIDPQSLDLNITHVQTLNLYCSIDAAGGSTAGKEVFTIKGAVASANKRPWDRAGSGEGNDYQPTFIGNINGFQNSVIQAQGQTTSCGASRASGNRIKNGDFESAISGSGNSKLPEFTFTAGEATTVAASTAGTDLINGLLGLKATAAFSFYENWLDGKPNIPYGLSIKLRPINGGAGTVTGTLTVTVISQDDATTYATLSIAFNGTNAPVNTNTQTAVQMFTLPNGVKPVKFVVALASLAGSAATPTVAIDDVICSEASLADGGRAIAIHDGSNLNNAGMIVGRWKERDTLSGGVKEPSNNASIMRAVNEVGGKYVRHSGISVTWNDPAI